MELYKDILVSFLENQEVQVTVTFPDLRLKVSEIVKYSCYDALSSIQDILRDDSLTDEDCYQKIEEIICVFESLGSNCGNRHSAR